LTEPMNSFVTAQEWEALFPAVQAIAKAEVQAIRSGGNKN